MKVYSMIVKHKDGKYIKIDKKPREVTDIEVVNLLIKNGVGGILPDLDNETFFGEDVNYLDERVGNHGWISYDLLNNLIKEIGNACYVSSKFWIEFTNRGGVLPDGMGLSFVGNSEVSFDITDNGEDYEVKELKSIIRELEEDEILVLAFNKDERIE